VELINENTRETRRGTSVTVSVVKTTQPIRPAKHTSLNDIRKMAKAKKSRRGFLRTLGIR
jgi:hypothetical protein